MSYLDDITYDEAVGPKARVAPTYDHLLLILEDEEAANYWLDSGHDLTLCDDLYDDEDNLVGNSEDEAYGLDNVGDTFTQQLAAELDADMAAIAFFVAFGEMAAA